MSDNSDNCSNECDSEVFTPSPIASAVVDIKDVSTPSIPANLPRPIPSTLSVDTNLTLSSTESSEKSLDIASSGAIEKANLSTPSGPSRRTRKPSSSPSPCSQGRLLTPQEILMSPDSHNLTLAQQIEMVRRYPTRQRQPGSSAILSPVRNASGNSQRSLSPSPMTVLTSVESSVSSIASLSSPSAPTPTAASSTDSLPQHKCFTVLPQPALLAVSPPDCCESHACLHYYANAGVFAHDFTNSFTYETTLVEQFTGRYRKLRDAAGTIANGKVYVAVSSVAPQPMLGLFAGREIKKNDVVTAYGGSRRPAEEIAAEPAAHVTHTRHIPSCLDALDGRPYSIMFGRDEALMAAEYHLPAEQRSRICPSFWDAAVLSRLVSGGVGYMTNTDVKSKHNVKIVDCDITKDGTLSRELFLIASRDIAAHEEILSPYNNRDSAVKRTMQFMKQRNSEERLSPGPAASAPAVGLDVIREETGDQMSESGNAENHGLSVISSAESAVEPHDDNEPSAKRQKK